MQLLSVLNNTVQITYNPEENQIKLGDMLEFIIPSNNGLIAQVFKLGFENDQYIACLRIFFTVKSGNWIKWLGNIPPKSSTIKKVEDQDIFELFGQFSKNNINLGFMPQHDMNMQIGLKNLDGTFILFDNNQNKIDHFNSLKEEFVKKDVPFIIFDFNNEYSTKKAPRITALKDFKLPLNVETLTSIHEKNFQYSSAEMRVLFEDVIAQVKNFFKQSDEIFIPFKIFKSVVDNEKPSIELSLLKNLLDKYEEQELFANTKADFLRLKAIFKKHNAYIIDMSEVPEEWQKEYIQFVIQSLSKFYVLMEDCKIFKSNKDIEEIICNKKSVKFIMAVNYSSDMLGEFIQKAKNLILCCPNKKINYFPNLTDYLSLLSFDEFIYQGEQTKYIPIMLQPKQEKENRIVKQIATVREVVKKPEEVIIKEAKQDNIEDIISEIEILHAQEDDVPLIQEAQKFEEINPEDISEIEELESLQEFSEEDFADNTIDDGYQEYEVVEIQDDIDNDIDKLFDQDLINDVDSLLKGESLSTETPNIELQQKIEEQKLQEQAQAHADAIDAKIEKQKQLEQEAVVKPTEIQDEVLEDSLFEDDELDILEDLQQQEELEFEEVIEQEITKEEIIEDLQDEIFEEVPQIEEESIELEIPELEEATIEETNVVVEEEPILTPNNGETQVVYEQVEPVPEYAVEEAPQPATEEKIEFKKGDMVEHEKFGKGIIKRILSHGSKKLYKIHFETAGIKLLDLNTIKVTKS